ncbi:hypothetical protein BKA62DRAFT_631308 [Auriculariales sp. MPI-PUGE-AT-0066]|nr:hypothetical protein BKA62DRAFT_631308 [Auriculariales sp. MPI-PUGE-AT-0066]
MAHREPRSSPPHHSYSLRATSSSNSIRPALAQLHPNLRRMPSRLKLAMPTREREHSNHHTEPAVKVGSKRKRVGSGAENYHGARPIRAPGGKHKRQRRSSSDDDDRDDPLSDMDVDPTPRWTPPGPNTDDDDDDGDDSTEDFMIRYAPLGQLNRLRRNELVRLAQLAGVSDQLDTAAATKAQIAHSIFEARDSNDNSDPESVPPTPSQEYSICLSSDDGHDAGGEETDVVRRRTAGRTPLGRRSTDSTLQDRAIRPIKGRSISMGLVNGKAAATKPQPRIGVTQASANLFATRRYASQQNIVAWRTSSDDQYALPSPPVTRHRKTSGKHVEFKNSIDSIGTTDGDEPSAGRTVKPSLHRRPLYPKLPDPQPSPRRLRSKSKLEHSDTRSHAVFQGGLLLQDESDLTEEDDIETPEIAQDDAELSDEEEEEEDERATSPPKTPTKSRRRQVPRALPSSTESSQPDQPFVSSVKRRLRPRRPQAFTPPSDGDEENDGDGEQEEEGADDQVSEEDEEDENMSTSVENDQSESEVDVEQPRILRNGKTVGDTVTAETESDESEKMDDAEATSAEDTDATVEEEVQVVDADEDMLEDDDVDLEGATAKSLTRLKRDDLLRMCASRDIQAEGTKPQLVDALLQWRERQSSVHCPSSTSTARPPSTARVSQPRARRHAKNKSNTPILLRDHIHTDEPRTPPVSSSERAKTIGGGKDEGELELDLESLGLEDHEIPPKDLLKLEKIGSGGFKDVFIGKLKNRKKVAISEFRGQLNAMDVKELKLLSEFDHPNVVKFLGVCVPDNTKDTAVSLVSELCTNGDLFDYVRNVPAPNLTKVLKIALDVAHGLEYLHIRKPPVLHRDCKSSNILITSKGTAKIADFGLAKVKQSTRSMVVSLVGTVNWQAPELWHAHPKYNYKVDVFSCGMVYWEMLQWHLPQKRYPWEGMNEHAIYDAVGAKRQRPSMTGMKKQWCPELVELIEQMWAQDPGDRPTMTEVVRELERIQMLYR